MKLVKSLSAEMRNWLTCFAVKLMHLQSQVQFPAHLKLPFDSKQKCEFDFCVMISVRLAGQTANCPYMAKILTLHDGSIH